MSIVAKRSPISASAELLLMTVLTDFDYSALNIATVWICNAHALMKGWLNLRGGADLRIYFAGL